MNAPVVVGVDGSPASLAAVDLVAREAALRGRALRVVHAIYESGRTGRVVRLSADGA